jgi:hypothetical protein
MMKVERLSFDDGRIPQPPAPAYLITEDGVPVVTLTSTALDSVVATGISVGVTTKMGFNFFDLR